MTPIKHYLQDGANRQARAVMCMLQDFSIESSWDSERRIYKAEPRIARWENCREQGYVITLWSENRKRLCIAFFEHRNSDSICAIKWEQEGINSPTIDTANFNGACYRDKWDVSKSVLAGGIAEMADWITEEMSKWWETNLPKEQ